MVSVAITCRMWHFSPGLHASQHQSLFMGFIPISGHSKAYPKCVNTNCIVLRSITSEPFYNFIEHAHSPLERANADTFIVAVNSPSFARSSIEAGCEAIHLRTQFCDVFCIGSTCQQEWDSGCLRVMFFEYSFDSIEEW